MTGARRQQLIDRLLALAAGADARWVHVPDHGLSVRHSETLPTPAWARERRIIPGMGGERTLPHWDEPTYQRHVFVTLVHRDAKPILSVARAPWMGRSDLDLTLTRALEVLEDPDSAL
jgi:hypothetical protein